MFLQLQITRTSFGQKSIAMGAGKAGFGVFQNFYEAVGVYHSLGVLMSPKGVVTYSCDIPKANGSKKFHG